MKLHIFGSYKGPTGYDTMVRNLARQMHDSGDEVHLIDHPSWSGIKIEYDELYDKLSEQEVFDADVMLSFCLPNQFPIAQHTFNVCFSMLECSRIPADWALQSWVTDLNIVPTESSKRAWMASGVPEYKIEICNLGVDPDIYNPDVEAAPLCDEDGVLLADRYPVRVLNIQELGPRKNIKGLLRSWMVGTRSDSGVCLILKLGSYSDNRMSKYKRTVDDLHRELGLTSRDYAPVFHHCVLLRSDQIPRVISAATHYVSASFGEGWDLPAMEAAAMQKSLIVPRHSAYLEWVSDEDATMVDVREIATDCTGNLRKVYDGASWWEPNGEQLASVFKKIDHNNGVEKAVKLRKKILERFTWKDAADRLRAILNDRWFDVEPAKVETAKDTRTVAWVPTIGTPCGIAAYSEQLCAAMLAQDKHSMKGWVGGNVLNHDRILDMNPDTDIEHFQMEYQFWAPVRLRAIGNELKKRGIPLVVTMHTVSTNEGAQKHNDIVRQIANKVIVHSDQARNALVDELGFDEQQVVKLPMPVKRIELSEDVQKLPEEPFKVGFFGFLYRHKGVLELAKAVSSLGKDVFLMMCASKPKNPHDEIDGELKEIIEQAGWTEEDYLWESDYVDDSKVVGLLSQCDLIVLPYKHYGSYGSSAAVNMCASAGKPMLLSDVCWFGHVDRKAALWCDQPDDQGSLADAVEKAMSLRCTGTYEDVVKSMDNWAHNSNVDLVASQHLELYASLREQC